MPWVLLTKSLAESSRGDLSQFESVAAAQCLMAPHYATKLSSADAWAKLIAAKEAVGLRFWMWYDEAGTIMTLALKRPKETVYIMTAAARIVKKASLQDLAAEWVAKYQEEMALLKATEAIAVITDAYSGGAEWYGLLLAAAGAQKTKAVAPAQDLAIGATRTLAGVYRVPAKPGG